MTNIERIQLVDENMSLSPIGALVTIWGVLLRKEFSESLGKFRIVLRNHRKKKSKEPLIEIKKAISSKNEEEALDEISGYTDDWYFLTQAVANLLEEGKKFDRWAKYVIKTPHPTNLRKLRTHEE